MAWTDKDLCNGKDKDPVVENGFLNCSQPSPSTSGSLAGTKTPEGKSSEVKESISYANILRSRNKFSDALTLYENVLEKDAGNVEAHIGKGICLQMKNMGRLAFDSFMEAIKLDEDNACALTHCGILYKDEGRLREAAESYQKALNADPSYKPAVECLAIVLTDLGTSLKLAGNTQEGLQKYYEALKTDPHYAPAYYNLGVVYSEMMQFDTALTCYEKAALERPMYAEAYCNMGVIYKNRGDLESAIACYERCLAVSPNFEIAKNNMAIALTDLGTKVKLEGDIDQGIAYYKKALYYNWHYADAMYNLGVAYGEMLKFDMAIVFYELAFHFNPHCAEACNNLGVIYKDRDNLDKAVECYQLALTIKPNFSQSLNNLGVVYTVQGKMDAAASMIEKAIVANPTYAEAYNNLGVLYRDAGNITMAIDAYEQCLKIDPDSRNAGQNRLLAMNYIHEGHDDKLFVAHRDWGRRFMRLFSQHSSWDNQKDPERPLVIGYVSPDYFTHSVSYFIEAPLAHYDYTKFKVVVYSAVVKADAKTIRFREKVLKKGGIWRDVYGIDEKKVASIIREDKVDILVELTGHTANNKLGTMACRPAHVQVTWIGYPNTTGLPAIDYRITNSLADSPDSKQKKLRPSLLRVALSHGVIIVLQPNQLYVAEIWRTISKMGILQTLQKRTLAMSGAKRGFSDAIDGTSKKWLFGMINGSEAGEAAVLFSPKGESNAKTQQLCLSQTKKEVAASVVPQSPKPVQEKQKPQVSEHVTPPAAKAQVVGWPPIRSFRKNTMASNLAKNNDDAEGKQGSGCLYVKVSMDGAPYLRKIDLKMYNNYMELSMTLKMFSWNSLNNYMELSMMLKMFSCFTIGAVLSISFTL